MLTAFAAIILTSKAGPLAQFRTTVGEIDVELFDQDKPITVKNFMRYVDSGRFTNFQIIHRWLPGFIIQGGGRYVGDRGTPNQYLYSIPSFGTNLFEGSIGQKYSNLYGTIAMARVGTDLNSASSDWFINLADNENLDTQDGGYTVFGRVVAGTNVLNKFVPAAANGLYRVRVNDLAIETAPVTLPVTNITSFEILYNSFVYVDITMLRVLVQPLATGGQEISWNSVTNKINRVEFTTIFPPVWETLASTNGTGGRLSAVDANTSHHKAFYRVRVEP